MDEGATSFTSMVMVAVSLPPVLLPVTVYVDEAVMAVGVPEMAPVAVSKDNPAGSDGLTDQATTAPPLVVGVTVDMVEPLVRTSELGL